ncbi:tRNA (adenosine(37)-N6)-threonylcarbamoyltransferase complex transferase subunit TsaD [bacterium]|nr:MAG: tRNA (adenosine(37)-N6)-threonylcarbamoyltransferase complex transferase subunit TsaD [bacterium]
MKAQIRTILAIESSCDETACAIIRGGREVLANIIASQADLHAQFGGVVPEVAARSHIEVVIPVIEEALQDANLSWDDIDAIAVTRGPGLIGSLLIGVLTAQVLAVEKNKPLIGVNHILAHAYASFLDTDSDRPLARERSVSLDEAQANANAELRTVRLDANQGSQEERDRAYLEVREISEDTADAELRQTDSPVFPMLALIVSGGDSRLMLFQEDLSFELIGQTRDDAAGEAFDKVAKLLGLPYPGGPNISRVAENGNDQAYKFPIANLGDSHDFSFSGLKTAVLRQVQAIVGDKPGLKDLRKTYQLPPDVVSDIAASFERTVVETLVRGLLRAYNAYTPASVVIGGGVSANQRLREAILAKIPDARVVPPVFCTDNAAMIGALAYQMVQRNSGVIAPKELIETELVADSSLETL